MDQELEATEPTINRSQLTTFLLAAASFAIAGAAFRYLLSLNDSLWLDELHTSWVVRDGIGDVFQRASIGNQTPLYFWATWLSCQVFGFNEVGLRMVSILSSTTLIPLAGWVVLKATRSNIASSATMLMLLIADPFLYYGTEARPYALLQLLGLVQILFFWRLYKITFSPDVLDFSKSQIRFASIGFAISSLLLVYVHITGALVTFPELLILLTTSIRESKNQKANRKEIITTWAMVLVILVVGALPLAGVVMTAQSRASLWASVASIKGLLNDQIGFLIGWIVFPALVTIIVQTLRKKEAEKENGTGQLGFFNVILFWSIGVLLSVAMIHALGIAPLGMSRYLSVAAVGGPILIGLMFRDVPKLMWQSGLLAVLLAVFTVMSAVQGQWWYQSTMRNRVLPIRNEAWSQVIYEINADESRRAYPLFLFPAVLEDEFALQDDDEAFQEYLKFPVHGLYRVKNEQVMVGPTLAAKHFDAARLNFANQSPGAWILVRHEHEIQDEITTQFLLRSKRKQKSVQVFWPKPGIVALIRIDFEPIDR